MDLKIQINDKTVDTNGVNLKWVRYSPYFVTNGVYGETSYPIILPWSNNNALVFGLMKDTSLDIASNIDYRVNVLQDGVGFIEGVFKITSITNLGIKGVITGNFTTVKDELKASIRDVDYSGWWSDWQTQNPHVDPDLVNYDNYAQFYEAQAGFEKFRHPFSFFPVLDKGAYPNWTDDYIAYFWTPLQSFLSPMNTKAASSDTFLFYKHSPNYHSVVHPQMTYVITKIFEHLGYTVQGSFMDDIDIKKIMIVSNNIVGASDLDLSKRLPDISINDFIKAITRKFNIGFSFNLLDKVVTINFNSDILNITDYIDITTKIGPQTTIGPTNESGYIFRDSIDSNDDWQKSHLIDTSKFTDVAIVDDYADLPGTSVFDTGKIAYVTNLEKYYELIENDETGSALHWEFLCYKEDVDIYKDGDDDFISGVAIPHNEEVVWYNVDYSTRQHSGNTLFPDASNPLHNTPEVVNIPIIDTPMNSYAARNEDGVPAKDHSFGLNLLFWAGIANNPAKSGYYSLGTASNYKPDGSKFADFSLFTSGAEGTFNAFWKAWLMQINEKEPIKIQALLSEFDIATLDMTKPIKILDEFFFIRSISVNVPVKGACQLDVYKIHPIIGDSQIQDGIVEGTDYVEAAT